MSEKGPMSDHPKEPSPPPPAVVPVAPVPEANVREVPREIRRDDATAMLAKHAVTLIGVAHAGVPTHRFRCCECQLAWDGTRDGHPDDPECGVWRALRARQSAADVLREVGKLREALAKATSPPWCFESVNEKGDECCLGVALREDDTYVVGEIDRSDETTFVDECVAKEVSRENAALIVATVNALPKLLDYIGAAVSATDVLGAADTGEGTTGLKALDYDALDAGIRDVVRQLRSAGFETTDSGDGISKPPDSRVFELPHVAVSTRPERLVCDGVAILSILGQDWRVEASFCPNDHSAIVLACKNTGP